VPDVVSPPLQSIVAFRCRGDESWPDWPNQRRRAGPERAAQLPRGAARRVGVPFPGLRRNFREVFQFRQL